MSKIELLSVTVQLRKNIVYVNCDQNLEPQNLEPHQLLPLLLSSANIPPLQFRWSD